MNDVARTMRKKPSVRLAQADAGAPPESVDVGMLGRHLGYALKRAQLRVFDDFVDAVASLKLSPAQFSVLILLDAMEARGLCRRTRSADDRRSHVLALTDKGRTILAKATRLVSAKHEKKLATLLSATERAQLMAMLERIARAL